MNTTRSKTPRMIAAGGALVAALAGVGLSAAPAHALYNQTDAVAGEYPFYVNVAGWCGGALIDAEWVLTAEHCASTDETLGKQMRVGYVSEAQPGVTTIARERVPSEIADIALIRVDPVTSVKPIAIDIQQVKNGDLARSVAGGTGSNGKVGWADFRVTDQPGPFNSSQNPTNFTARGLDPATGTCFGDSGSPLVRMTADGPRLTGVLSAFIPGCTEPNGEDYYVSPQTFLISNWIYSKVGKRLGEYAIQNKNSGKVLDINSAGEVVQRDWVKSSATQKWTFAKDVGSTPVPATNPVNVRNVGSAKLMGIAGGSPENRAPAIQWPDVDVADQSWSFVATDDGYFKVVNNNSAKVLGIPGGSRAEGEIAVQWDSVGVDDQRWVLVKVG